jgi:lysophospholipase L1-like esterase
MTKAARTTGQSACALAAVLLLVHPVRAEPFTLVVLGDSLSDTYFLKVSLTERSWTDQLRLLRESRVKLYNQASGGSTSTAMLAQRQPEKAAELVRPGKVQNVCLIIGGNDLGFPLLIPGGAGLGYLDTAAAKLVENIPRALDTIQAAGPAAVVLGNVPDLGDTPFFRQWTDSNPAQAERLTRLTAEVNRRLAHLAVERGIPLVVHHF